MVRDLNGRPENQSRLAAFFRRLHQPAETDLTATDPHWVTVADSADDAASASSVLAEAAEFDPSKQSVLVHRLRLAPDRRAAALTAIAPEGYIELPTGEASTEDVMDVGRVQLVDALHVSQERSRMAGLCARLGGEATRWQVRQLP